MNETFNSDKLFHIKLTKECNEEEWAEYFKTFPRTNLYSAYILGSQLFTKLLISVGRNLTSPRANSASTFKSIMHFI